MKNKFRNLQLFYTIIIKNCLQLMRVKQIKYLNYLATMSKPEILTNAEHSP